MDSDPDLSPQPDILKQPPLMKKKSDPMWKVNFNLLLVVNLLLGGWAGIMIIVSALPLPSNYSGIAAATLAGYYLLILAPIDLIAILFYGRLHGILRILTYVNLISAALLLIAYFFVVLIIFYF